MTLLGSLESRVLDTLSGRSGGGVSNAALHALFSNEVVRPNAQADEFWFRIGHRLIRFSRYEYALVTGLRFGDSDFDVHGDDVPTEGSLYDRYPLLSSGGQMLDRIRDRFADGYFRQQSGDALKVVKVLCVCYLLFGVDGGKRIAGRWLWTLVEDQTRWESFPWGGYSYQILVTYLSDVPIEVSAGLDPSYHFYGNIYAIMIWACEAIPSLGSKCGTMFGASFIQRPRCTRWKFKKLGHVSFSTFFNDEIDCFEVLSPTPEEEQEPYIQSITSSPIRGPHQTASSSAQGTKETAHITDLDTLFTQLRQYVDSTAQQIYRYIDTTAQETRRHIDTTAEETRRRMEELFATTQWPFRDIDEFMSNSPHDGSVPTGPRVAQTENIPTADVDRPSSPIEFRKRKDLDEEAYCRWLDSDESVNVGAACGASAFWFLMLQDGSKLIDAEHLDAYMGILQFDPAFVGVRWLDDWAHQTVLVHTSFLRRKGSSMIDSDDLAFLVSHVHGLRPFWGDHRPWWELRVDHLEYVSNSSSGHWVLPRIHLEESVICMHDSLAQGQKAWLKLRDRQSMRLSRLIPIILREAGFYERLQIEFDTLKLNIIKFKLSLIY
ncbi:hypothetical protein OROGR_016974 [Orobanche gracilis]